MTSVDHERHTVRQKLRSQVLFMLTREEVRRAANEWPEPALSETKQRWAINGALNMLLTYPHRKWEAWDDYISAPPTKIAEMYARWRGDESFHPSPEGHVARLGPPRRTTRAGSAISSRRVRLICPCLRQRGAA